MQNRAWSAPRGGLSVRARGNARLDWVVSNLINQGKSGTEDDRAPVALSRAPCCRGIALTICGNCQTLARAGR
jgi:hypothetical protein